MIVPFVNLFSTAFVYVSAFPVVLGAWVFPCEIFHGKTLMAGKVNVNVAPFSYVYGEPARDARIRDFIIFFDKSVEWNGHFRYGG